ncbi:16S rRNA methyltransferase, partial [Streptomyces rubellomurinus subsp. indigoferus]
MRPPSPPPDRHLLGAADIRPLAAAFGVKPTKHRGQNFVIGGNPVRRIVRAAAVPEQASVVEGGPGLASITLALRGVARHDTAVEIAPVLAQHLPDTVAARTPSRAASFD